MNGTQKKEIKKLFEETLNEMFKTQRKEIFSLFLDAMEEYGLSIAIKERRKNKFVEERRILKSLSGSK